MRRILHTFFLATLLNGTAIAQDSSDVILIEDAKARMVESLSLPATAITFEEVRVSRDQSNAVVCGTANGKRFIAGSGKKASTPTIEGRFSPSMFNYVWNLRCQGIKTSDAISSLGKDSREEICTVLNWNWTRWGTRSIQIQGLASCQNGRILIKVFDGSEYLGSGTDRIEAQAFTVYVDRLPTSDKLRIEYATGK